MSIFINLPFRISFLDKACDDQFALCSEYAKNNYCTDYKKQMETQCRKSCNFCSKLFSFCLFLIVELFKIRIERKTSSNVFILNLKINIYISWIIRKQLFTQIFNYFFSTRRSFISRSCIFKNNWWRCFWFRRFLRIRWTRSF